MIMAAFASAPTAARTQLAIRKEAASSSCIRLSMAANKVGLGTGMETGREWQYSALQLHELLWCEQPSRFVMFLTQNVLGRLCIHLL